MKEKIINVLNNPRRTINNLLYRHRSMLCDRLFIKVFWFQRMGYTLDLKNPKTYNEKLQWLKLYDRRPEYTTMVDKYAVKEYVANIIGEEYIIPTLGVWDKPEDIDWEKLPNQFVLKCTHDSGGLVICKDKSSFDKQAAIKKLSDSLKCNYYKAGREWPYKNVPRRIIAEQYMEDADTKELRDYKFFCFNGKVKALFIATGRQIREEPYFDFFDADFNYINMRHGHPNAPIRPSKPKSFELMKQLAEKISNGLIEARVDFYEINGAPKFGEITFYHHGGFMPFDPQVKDKEFGEWIELPIAARR